MLTLGDIQARLNRLDNWSLEGGNAIRKDFVFENFKEALEFVNKIGEIAEQKNHHPDILMNYNKVGLRLTTHAESGLSSKDFDVAEEIDNIK